MQKLSKVVEAGLIQEVLQGTSRAIPWNQTQVSNEVLAAWIRNLHCMAATDARLHGWNRSSSLAELKSASAAAFKYDCRNGKIRCGLALELNKVCEVAPFQNQQRNFKERCSQDPTLMRMLVGGTSGGPRKSIGTACPP